MQSPLHRLRKPTIGILDQLASIDRNEAIHRLQGSYRDFCAAIEATLEHTVRAPIAPDDASEEQALVCRKAAELRQFGYTQLQSLIPAGELSIPRAFVDALPARAAVLGVAQQMVNDHQLGGSFWGRHVSNFNTRFAFRAALVPPFLQPLLNHTALCERIILKAVGLGAPVLERNLLIFDNLQPTDAVDFQWWHFDRLFEQYKAMIFLDDVTDGNGPMRLLPGSHRFEGSRRMYDFAIYAEPFHGGDPGYAVIEDRLADIVSAVGKAGDAFLFDTKAFHAHGRPTHGKRSTATLYYTPPDTPLNRFYRRYQPAGQTNKY
jgi:hypothetical protein